jgi:hypothetical protein
MNIKKIVIILIFAIAIIGITPVYAALNGNVTTLDQTNDSNLHVFVITSNIGMKTKDPWTYKFASERKKEINTVNKAVISINGYKAITFKKPVKGWKTHKELDYTDYTEKYFKLKGKTLNKNFSIKLYANGKLIKTSKGKIKYPRQ